MIELDGGPLDGPYETMVQNLWKIADDSPSGGYCVRIDDALDLMDWPTVRARARDIAVALADAGIGPDDRVAILAETSRDWKLVDHAIHAAGAVVVPVYPTLPADVVQHILKDSGAKAVFVQDAAQAAKLPDDPVPVWSFTEVDGCTPLSDVPVCGKKSAAAVDKRVAAMSLDAPCLLIYTSGTTGVPKGVLLSHRNIAGDVVSTVEYLDLQDVKDPSLVAFLPLAHVAGYVSLAAMGYLDAKVLFSRPDHMAEDLQWFRPTIALAVPRLWERIVRKVETAVSESSPVRQALFAAARGVAIEAGRHLEKGSRLPFGLGIRHALFERLVYSKLRARLGFDRLHLGITGAAAVRPDLLWFLQGIGLPIVEGYGMTESSALSVGTRMSDWRAGFVGRPLPGQKIRLDEDGEILIGGIGVFQEYWNLPEDTASTRVFIDGEPWVRSGDIGEIEDGRLRIIDRKKELEVLDTGKKIAPIRVEEMLKSETSFVEDSILVGTGRKFAGLLIQPAYDSLIAWAKDHGLAPDPDKVVRQKAPTGEVQTYAIDDEAFLAHPSVRDLFKDAIDKMNHRLADFEQVRVFSLIPNAFTVDREELTPSFKKRRKNILANHKERMEAMFTATRPSSDGRDQ